MINESENLYMRKILLDHAFDSDNTDAALQGYVTNNKSKLIIFSEEKER